MIALDTNILIRIMTADEADGARRARKLVDESDVFVGSTVLLETAWVLKTRYGYPQSAVTAALRGFAGLPRVKLEASEEIHRALVWAQQGMDLADAFHLSLSERVGPLATFDEDLLRQARTHGVAVIEP